MNNYFHVAHFTMLAMALAVLLTLQQPVKEELKMKAKEAQCASVVMDKAMDTVAYQTPPSNQLLLESPNTIVNRKARENFYKVAGQAQGLHVRF